MDALRQAVDDARANEDSAAATTVVQQVSALYTNRPETAAGRGEVEAHANDIMAPCA